MLLVEVDEDLGVAIGREAVPGALQLPLQLAVVVDLAVLDDDDAAVLVGDRLVPVREVDDRKPPRRQSDRPAMEEPLARRVRDGRACALIRATASRSGASLEPAIPQIPHMSGQSRQARPTRLHLHVYRKRKCRRVAKRESVAVVPWSGGPAAEDLGDGGEENAEVERDRAIGDVLHVVGELVGP